MYRRKPHDEVIDGPRVRVLVQAPDLLQNLFARDDLAIVSDEVAQQLRFHQREADRAVAPSGVPVRRNRSCGRQKKKFRNPPRCRAHFPWTCRVLPPHPLAAAQQSLQARQQNREIEGLRQGNRPLRGETFQHILRDARSRSASAPEHNCAPRAAPRRRSNPSLPGSMMSSTTASNFSCLPSRRSVAPRHRRRPQPRILLPRD